MGKHQTVPNHIIFEIKDSQQTFGEEGWKNRMPSRDWRLGKKEENPEKAVGYLDPILQFLD